MLNYLYQLSEQIRDGKELVIHPDDQQTLTEIVKAATLTQKGSWELQHPLLNNPFTFHTKPTEREIVRAFVRHFINEAWIEKQKQVSAAALKAVEQVLAESYPNAIHQPVPELATVIQSTVTKWVTQNASLVDLRLIPLPTQAVFSFDHAEAKGKIAVERGAYGISITVNDAPEAQAVVDLFYCATEGKSPILRIYDENGDTKTTEDLW